MSPATEGAKVAGRQFLENEFHKKKQTVENIDMQIEKSAEQMEKAQEKIARSKKREKRRTSWI